MSDDFAIGDFVWLKSGGPKMTVTGDGRGLANVDAMLSGKKVVECTWFDGAKLMHGTFPPAALTRERPNEP